nr:phenylalanine--tRNA ligase subunit beta [Amycolatopsis umgeniensis]
MSVSLLRSYCPALPAGASDVRQALDEAGIEVKGVESAGGDTVISVELLANRGDHRCYTGVARELAARLDGVVAAPPSRLLTVAEDNGFPVVVRTEKCLAYTLTPLVVRDSGVLLPGEVRSALAVAEETTGSVIVDATNAAALELGQPTHAFDADRLTGTIEVRLSGAGETALLLGETTRRELPEGTIVIADEVKVLAVAGVIGCEESRVTENTRRVLLESGTFDPVEVRKAASALNVRTAASQRFERGGDPTLPLAGAGRVVRLLEECGAAAVSGPTVCAREWHGDLPVIDVDFDDLADFLAIPSSPEDVVRRLAGYGLRHLEGGRFQVPGSRIWDLVEAQDVYEELARNIGYDELPGSASFSGSGVGQSDEAADLRAAGEILVSLGFYEVFTDSFYDRSLLKRLGVEPDSPLAHHIRLVDAADRHYEFLKNNCLAQAVEAVDINLRNHSPDLRLFELATVFRPDRDGGCAERSLLWAICAGSGLPHGWDGKQRPVDLFFAKGAVEEIANALNRDLTVRLPDEAEHPLTPYLHPNRAAVLYFDGVPAGVLGEIHPEVLKRFGVTGVRPVYLELETSALTAAPAKPRPPLEDVPPITRMLDFVLPAPVSSAEVMEVLRAAAPDRLRDLRVTDVFVDPGQFGVGARSVTYLLVLAVEPTPTSEELNAEVQLMIDAVATVFGDEGVVLR